MSIPTYYIGDVPALGEVFKYAGLLLKAEPESKEDCCAGCRFEHNLFSCAAAPNCGGTIFVVHKEPK